MNQTQRNGPRRGDLGFTLLEVLLAVSISAGAIVMVGTTFEATVRAKDSVENLANSTSMGPRIMSLIERDLSGLWHHNITDNKVFVGRNMDLGGIEADRIDFLTTTDAVGYVVDSNSNEHRPSICEVGYWLRPHPRYPELLQLWRREDPMVDDDLIRGGQFQLVCDRLKMFKILYFETVGFEAEEKFEWDSSKEDSLPRRIQIEFVVEPLRTNRNAEAAFEIEDDETTERRFVRHFVFDQETMEILQGGVAMKPVIPGRPEAAEAGPVGAGAGDPTGATGPGMAITQGETPGGPPPGASDGGGRGGGNRGEGFGNRGGGQGGGRGGGFGQVPGGNRGGGAGNPFGGGGLPPGFNLGDLIRGG